MYVKRNFSILSIMRFPGEQLIWLTLFGLISGIVYEVIDFR